MSDTEPRRRVTGDEADAYSRYWRRWVNWRPGERAAVKRRTNRRERRERQRDAEQRVGEETVPCACDDRACLECW